MTLLKNLKRKTISKLSFAVSLENISHSYGDLEVLKEFTLRVEPGEKIALIGGNGVGKTTLCKIIMEELKPTSGNVIWGATVENSYFPQDTADKISGNGTLYNFDGDVICVSHDRELLDAFATRIVELHADGSYIDFKGTYEEFVAAKANGTL
jgi:ATPase subunit of ABC transporter with duplicated ATPase domains